MRPSTHLRLAFRRPQTLESSRSPAVRGVWLSLPTWTTRAWLLRRKRQDLELSFSGEEPIQTPTCFACSVAFSAELNSWTLSIRSRWSIAAESGAVGFHSHKT
jgi:hypothetical protein